MRTTEYVEAPYQGVSQAATQVRLPTQAEAIENAWAAIPGGATKRPPFDYLATLTGPTSGSLHEAFIRRSEGDFLLTITREGSATVPRLYDLDTPTGTPIAVTISAEAQAYLNESSSPQDDFRTLTVEDYTFILNRQVTVENSADTAPTRPYEAMLWVRQAAYARTYVVIVRHGVGMGTTLTVTLVTPNGKDATDGKDVDTDIIAGGLYGSSYPVGSTSAANGASITGSLSSLTGAGFTVTLQGGVIYLSHPTLDFSLEVQDGQGGEALLAIKDRVQSFSQLPKRAVDGFQVRLTQQTGSDEDDFFVTFEETAGKGTGVWTESLAAGAELGLDPETMPVGLVYDQGAATWSLDVLGWEQREVGNENLSPDPGFIGAPLKDITFWRGRLTVVFAEGARCASSSNPLGFYPTTLSQVLASDPFEVANPLKAQAFFDAAVAFKKDLVLWGLKGQALVTAAGDVLTPETAYCTEYAAYEFAAGVPPQASGDRIYFAAPRGTLATAVYELELVKGASQETAEGDDLTVAVPRYLPGGLNKVATCPVSYLTAYGKAGSSALTVHLYRYAERQRVQNAWQRWALPESCTLAGMFFDNTRLYVLVLRGGAIHVLRGDVAEGATDAGSTYLTKIDFKVSDSALTKTYDAVADVTELVLPYVAGKKPLVVVATPGGVGGLLVDGDLMDAPEGTLPEVESWSADTAFLTGDWTSAPLIAGETYTGEITLSTLFARDPEGRPDRSGRLMLRKIIFDVADTAVLRARVRVGGRAERTYTFEASRFDTPDADYDQVNLYTGEWSVPIGGSSEECEITIEFDEWAPGSVLGYTWVGEFNPKARQRV